jgi:ABC-type transport system involved in cytochrome bd biosynthesis fused ATPase/permease subunit
MNEDWKNDWETWKVEEPEIAFIKSVHSLGNLTIVINRTNSLLGNKSYAEKLAIYGDETRAHLTDYIKDQSKWTPTEIEERATDLLKKAIARWPYPTTQQ